MIDAETVHSRVGNIWNTFIFDVESFSLSLFLSVRHSRQSRSQSVNLHFRAYSHITSYVRQRSTFVRRHPTIQRWIGAIPRQSLSPLSKQALLPVSEQLSASQVQ